jgi:hypothetical protein
MCLVNIVCLSPTRGSSHRLCIMVPLAAGRHFASTAGTESELQVGDVTQIKLHLEAGPGVDD